MSFGELIRRALTSYVRGEHVDEITILPDGKITPPEAEFFLRSSRPMSEIVVKYGTFIAFVDEGVPRGQKTHVYRVQVNNISTPEVDSIVLGTVKWFGRWRGYAYHPCQQTVYEQVCLREIALFCETTTREHTARRKAKS